MGIEQDLAEMARARIAELEAELATAKKRAHVAEQSLGNERGGFLARINELIERAVAAETALAAAREALADAEEWRSMYASELAAAREELDINPRIVNGEPVCSGMNGCPVSADCYPHLRDGDCAPGIRKQREDLRRRAESAESALAAALERIDELSFPKEYIPPGPEREAALKNLRASADAGLPLPARVPEMPPVKPPLVSDDAGRVERVREAILGYGLARQVICEDVRFTQPMTKESAAELARAVLAAADGAARAGKG